jgi:hypothetical protein
MPFSQQLRWKHSWIIVFIVLLQNHCLTLPNMVPQWPHTHSDRTYSKAGHIFLHFSAAFHWAFTELENYIEAETIPIGIKSSYNEKIGSKEGRQVVWQPIPIHITSLICFHLNCVDSGKDNSSSESHFQNSQANRGCTVKRVDEVVRHPHLVTQDQNTQVLNKVSDIPEENFTINIELFRQTFTNVELLR